MDYLVLNYDNTMTLRKKVLELYKQGYICQGGVSVYVSCHNDVKYIQAMIKNKKGN